MQLPLYIKALSNGRIQSSFSGIAVWERATLHSTIQFHKKTSAGVWNGEIKIVKQWEGKPL